MLTCVRMVRGGHLEEGEADALRPQLVQQSVQNADIRHAEQSGQKFISAENGKTSVAEPEPVEPKLF